VLSNSADPSHTVNLRERQYRPELTGRVRRLAAAVNKTIGENDALAISERRTTDAALEDYRIPETLDDGSLAATRAAFNRWLQEQAEQGVLEKMGRAEVTAGRHYTAKYVRSAETKGEAFATAQLEGAGIAIDAGEDVLPRAQRSQLLSRLFSRNYNELETLTGDITDDVRDTLTFGMLRGENPRDVGRQISKRVRKVGVHRAEMIARTETLRAHNETALDVYDHWFNDDRAVGYGIEGASSTPGKKMEHTTAGDNRVCAQCQALEGQQYTIQEVRNNRSDLLPPQATHPQCRCVLILINT